MDRRSHPLSFVGAGLAGGAVFLVVELLLLPPTKHVRFDWILRLLAAFLAGPVTLTSPRSADAALIVPAVGIHAAFSLAFGWVFCRMEDTLPFWRAILFSLALAFGLYMFNFHVMTYVFPWWATVRGGVTILAHLLFGVTTVLAHKGLGSIRLRPRVPSLEA
ncbi:MAG TPA: hypothetical protein VMI75_32105 [Polyangiaceae bacterium]|nr:hypothetical protein [Polyangiaceae bacterium]